MADTKTNEEVMEAVTELREVVEKKAFLDPERVERLNTVLDGYEAKNAEITTIQEAAKNLEVDIKALQEAQKEYKQADETRQTELKQQITDLEAEVARGIEIKSVNPEEAYKEKAEYKSLQLYCTQGERILFEEEHKVLLRTDSGVDGGILVPTELDNVVTKKITEIDPIRGIARVRSITSKSMEMAIRSGIPVATYEGEGDAGGDSASAYESETVTPYRQTHTTPITRDMLMDAAFDMESEISSDSAEAFAFGEGNGFVAGTGFKQPAGFINNAAVITGARTGLVTSGVIDPAELILLTGDLKVGYNPVYVMNRRSLAVIRTFRGDAASAADGAGQFLWNPGMSGPVANTLNGFPYVLANSMPDVGNSAKVICFGDFRRGYTIVDRTGMSIVRDEVTQKKKAIIEFTMNRWNTGLVTLPEALKLYILKA